MFIGLHQVKGNRFRQYLYLGKSGKKRTVKKNTGIKFITIFLCLLLFSIYFDVFFAKFPIFSGFIFPLYAIIDFIIYSFIKKDKLKIISRLIFGPISLAIILFVLTLTFGFTNYYFLEQKVIKIGNEIKHLCEKESCPKSNNGFLFGNSFTYLNEGGDLLIVFYDFKGNKVVYDIKKSKISKHSF